MNHPHAGHDQQLQTTNTEQQPLYACPMHPDVVSDAPGVCPKCHMALEKLRQPNLKKSTSHQHTADHHAGHTVNMFKQKFWLSLILTLPALVFSSTVQSWFGLRFSFSGSEYIPAIFGTIIFFYGGVVFLKSARGELAARRPGMMTLVSMAISVAFLYSLLVTFRIVSGMDFWWELATLVTIMLLGHWLEMASVQSAQGALKELAKLLPDQAELLTSGQNTKLVPVATLKVGDLVMVRPGTKLPADGEVTEGSSDVNESMLTGESKPVKKIKQSTVIGGTLNGNGALTVRITKVGGDTTLAGIMKLVSEAQTSKSRTQVLADRAAFYLTIVALAAAIATGVVWIVLGQSAAFVLERVVTVLVIACPHALGLAVPLVTAISTTLAAKNGLLVRQRMALETARNVDVVLFDKTGTLTKGEQGVTDIWASEGYDSNTILQLTASIEQPSEHIIGKSIIQKARSAHLTLSSVEDFSALPGVGVTGTLGKRDTYVVVSQRYLVDKEIVVDESVRLAAERATKDGKTIAYLIKNSAVIGALALADQIRPESRETVRTLQHMGIKTAMITGDSKDVAASVARELGLDQFFAEVRPNDKSARVKQLQNNGKRVAMVGDGVNDAPALARADVGIAIGAGTDVAIESAGIILISNDPRGVVKAIRLSRQTYRKMLQNLVWAAGYNALAIPLAAGVTSGWGFVLSPAFGAVLMSLSTIIVAANAQLLRRARIQN